jgi:hypothetical protein
MEMAALPTAIHQPAIVSQQFRIGGWRTAGEQADVLHGFVAPEIAHCRGDVADGTEVSAGRRFAFHRNGAAGDRLDDGPS